MFHSCTCWFITNALLLSVLYSSCCLLSSAIVPEDETLLGHCTIMEIFWLELYVFYIFLSLFEQMFSTVSENLKPLYDGCSDNRTNWQKLADEHERKLLQSTQGMWQLWATPTEMKYNTKSNPLKCTVLELCICWSSLFLWSRRPIVFM